MAQPHQFHQNGIPPQYAQHQQQQPGTASPAADAHRGRTRPFSLEEALPYTPFTSVFPFNPDILNNPTIAAGSLAPSLAHRVSRDDFDALNREAENSHQSKRIDSSLEYVSHLLRAEKTTQYQFKTAPNLSLPTPSSTKSLMDGLSPFTKLVLDNASPDFRYPSASNSAVATPTNRPNMPAASKKSPNQRKSDVHKVVKHNPAALNAQAVARNKSRIEIHLPTIAQRHAAEALLAGRSPAPAPSTTSSQPQTVSPADLMMPTKVTPVPLPQIPPMPTKSPAPAAPASPQQSVPPEPSQVAPKIEKQDTSPQSITSASQEPPSSAALSSQKATVIVELSNTNFNKEEFAVVPDSPDAPTHLSTRRTDGDYDDPLNADLNQQERAKIIFADLKRSLLEIFHAEEQFSYQQGTSSHLIYMTQEQEMTMTSAAHERTQKQIKRAIDAGCFGRAPADSLHRIQRLSEASLKYAESIDVKMSDSWGETEVGFWLQQLPEIDIGLRAARTALRIMCGGREEKQLYSEDLITLGLNLFRNVIEGVIVPIAELRNSGSTAELFRLLTPHKKLIVAVFNSSQRLYSLMSDLISSIEVSETFSSSLEYLSSQLMFVENAYTEKDSVVGVIKFDGLRLIAMNMLSQIFLRSPAQREGILRELLSSLEKLPVGKQKARQFKLSEGGSIQPISALIMRLVQASAGKVGDSKDSQRSQVMDSLEGNGIPLANTNNASAHSLCTIRTETQAAIDNDIAVQELEGLSTPLFTGAWRHANYVIQYIIKRASTSTKTGDTPYRNLLDLFIEDFTTCLDSPDWPAAELLLQITMNMMFKQIDDKNSAPARNMALELLGVMAASISKLRSHVRKIANGFEGSSSDELGTWLTDLSLSALDDTLSQDRAFMWEGPYRIVLEFIQDRVTEDEHLQSAVSYLVTDWASQACKAYDSPADEDSDERNMEFGRIAFRLRNMIEDPKWLAREWRFKSVGPTHAKLSQAIILLRSQFCRNFKVVLNILMGSMTTDQATVRSRSLKSVNQILETDPTILDGDSVFIDLILRCSSDSSPQVRDTALGLIGKCMTMRPQLEERMTPTVIDRFVDAGVGVRKRAMKLAKEIYLGNEKKAVRSTIANGLLHRMQDPDEGVRDLARQTIEEIWMSPFYKEDESVAFKQSLTDHVALIVQTAKQGNTSLILDKVFQTILSPESKMCDANTRVCTKLVANMFDLLDNPDSDDPSMPAGKDALQVLMILAKADPKLFTFEQVKLLEPHIVSVGTSEDLAVSRAVVVIYRRVLPQVSSVHSQFLTTIRSSLLRATPKVTRSLLDYIVACVWIICGLLQSTEPVAALVCSSLIGIQKIRGILAKGLAQTHIKMFERYSLIVGMIGKHCQLDSHTDFIRAKIPTWKDGTVSKLMVDILCPLANPNLPDDVRRPALDAIGLVCQSNPRNFVAKNVIFVFEQVFIQQTIALESMVLRSFKEFLFTEEQRSDQSTATASKEKRDLKVMGSTSFDDVASATTQRFLTEITRISLASQDDHAHLAVEILASINRQGLVHPKETGVTWITLETCPITKISELAYREHKALHEKHESVLEREYAKAVQAAFQYQRDVVKDPRGATESPFTSKLHLLIEILKISKAKNRQRCLEKIVGQLQFEALELDVSRSLPSQVAYSRFLVENIAFFEYVSIGDLQSVLAGLEKLVSGTGAGIAQMMESEIFQVRMDQEMIAEQLGAGDVAAAAPLFPDSIDRLRLRRLLSGSMILSAVWEARSHLRRLYGHSAKREVKGKGASKDLTKPPVKVQGVSGDKFWEDIATIMSALDTEERMMQQCKAFVDLMNVDSEVKIGAEDDVDAEGDPLTPDADDDDDEAGGDGRGRKRKAAGTPGGRGKKRARSNSRQPRGRGRPRKHQPEDDDDDDDESWG
ncbi:hypothetical protein GGR57DRAFT_465752 [Xylariaceae sp. FL1272]|nr:hypothetical protein GGR57DRAFT_465752 [Xylariaceae sp. FL1272]